MKRGLSIAGVVGLGSCLILSVLFTVVYGMLAIGEPVGFGYVALGAAVSVGLAVLIRGIAPASKEERSMDP